MCRGIANVHVGTLLRALAANANSTSQKLVHVFAFLCDLVT